MSSLATSNLDLLNFILNSPREHSGGDIQKTLENFPGFIWSKYSKEKHLPGHNFTGPGTRLDLRLNPDNTPKEDSKPINRVDAASYKHDLAYRNNDITSRHEADRKMIQELDSIQNPTFRERIERMFVKKALQTKMLFGQGIDLNERFATEIHKEYRKPKYLLKVKVFNKDDIWSADLINMPHKRGYKFALTVIDLYTRYA